MASGQASRTHTGREGETAAAWARAQAAKGPPQELGKARHAAGEPRSAPAAAAAVGRRSSSTYIPQPFACPLEAFAGSHGSRQERPSPHQSSLYLDRQGSRNAETSNAGSGGGSSSRRRNSTGLDQPRQHQVSSPSSLQRGGAAGWAPRDLAPGERERGGGVRGGREGGYGTGTSTQREHQTTSVTGLRRASVPSGRPEGKSISSRVAKASPAGERLVRAAEAAAAEALAAKDSRAMLDVWEEAKITGGGGAGGGGGWAPERRTQGDYLLQQRARGASRR